MLKIHYSLESKESAGNAGDLNSVPGLGRSPQEGKGYPFQYSGPANSMDCIVPGVAKSQTRLSDFEFQCVPDPVQSSGYLAMKKIVRTCALVQTVLDLTF